MITDEIKGKLERIANHTRQSTKFRNEGDAFVREMARSAREARISDVLPLEHIEGLAAEHYLMPMARSSRAEYPLNIIELASQRRNHKMMLKLLRHPDDMMRIQAAEQFQIMFAMLDGYFDEASALVNQILLVPTEIPEVKYALLRDAGRTSRRGLPREIADTARRLIHDMDQGVSYHALRLLSYLHDVRDWRAMLDRMITLVGEEDEAAAYFLWAGVEYLEVIIPYEPAVVEWIRSILESYPVNHMAVEAVHSYVQRNPDTALQVGLISRREYREMTGR
jgi:hypothetical protein